MAMAVVGVMGQVLMTLRFLIAVVGALGIMI
jgi:lipid-A-disaccharide synthase-like uncharacterized protein